MSKPQNLLTASGLLEQLETIDLSQLEEDEDMDTCFDFENLDPKNGSLVSGETLSKPQIQSTNGDPLENQEIIAESSDYDSDCSNEGDPQWVPGEDKVSDSESDCDSIVFPALCFGHGSINTLDYRPSFSKSGKKPSDKKEATCAVLNVNDAENCEPIQTDVVLSCEPIQTDSVSSTTSEKKVAISGFVKGQKEPTKKDKPHYCFICKSSATKLGRHFYVHHRDSEDLVEYFSLTNESEKRKKMKELRNIGDHLHNKEVWKNGYGNIVVKRRSSLKSKVVEDYIPCPDCLGYFNFKDMYRHKCLSNAGTKTKTRINNGRLLLPVAPGHAKPDDSDELKCAEILLRLKRDPPGMIVRTDPTIHELALRETRKNSFDPDRHQYIRHKLREIARLVLILRNLSGKPEGQLIDFLKAKNLKMIVQATRELSSYQERSSEFDNPSTAKKLGHTLKRCALLMETKALEEGNV